jgi:transglutaminase-like putative cysteine protease
MRKRLKDTLLSCLLALAVAAPMSYVLHLSLGLSYSGWYALLFAAASLLLLEVIGWNKWTAIFIPAGVLLASVIAWWALDIDQRQPFVDFYWWAVGFVYGGGVYTFGYGLILAAVTSFLITLFVWLFGRKFYFFPAVFVFVVAFVLIKWLSGLDCVLVPGMLACGGLIPLWAKSFQRKLAKRTGKALPVNGVALFLLPAAALVVTLGLASASEEASRNWQDRGVHDLFQRFNNYLSDYTQFNRPRNTFSIAVYGFMPMGDRLGGPVKLSDVNVMYVTAPRRMLLRGMIYNNYTGSLWTNTAGGQRHRFSGGADALRKDVFDLERPVLGAAAQEQFGWFVDHATITVRPLVDSTSTLFVPFRGINGISSGKFLGVLPYYNDCGEVFSSSNVLEGYSYSVEADCLRYDAGGFNEMMKGLMALGLKDTPEKEQYIRDHYLSLPDNIEKPVYALTDAVISGLYDEIFYSDGTLFVTPKSADAAEAPELNDYEKAVAIRDFLMKYARYTLEPPEPPEGVDFVSYFLDHDREGYCTYFASAMAVMARIAGIPSRYVEGYMLPDKLAGSAAYKVQGKNAHAWAELYFEGIGWIPFDATPSGENTGNAPAGGSDIYEPPIPTPPPSNGQPGNYFEPVDGGLTWSDIASHLWMLPVAAAVFALAWTAAMMMRSKARVSERSVKRKYGDTRRQCAFYYFELLRLLEYYNYPVKPGETPYAYAARIDGWLRLEAGTFSEAADIIALVSYSDYEPGEKDVEFLCSLRRCLAGYTYRTVGPWFYLWHQVLGFGRKANRNRRD